MRFCHEPLAWEIRQPLPTFPTQNKLRKNRDFYMESAQEGFYSWVGMHQVSGGKEWAFNASQRVDNNR